MRADEVATLARSATVQLTANPRAEDAENELGNTTALEFRIV